MAGDYKTFDSGLRWTWVSNETGLYSGSLTIAYDTITIDGYGETGIPYLYTELVSYPTKYKLLEFTFGGRKEILQQ